MDHTPHLLSRHFGPGFKKEFQRLASGCFDRNAAYLLACGLRNYSQHQDEIINYRAVESSPRVPGVPLTFRPILGIVPSLAVGKNSGQTRREMLRATFPIRIDRLVAEAMNECERLLLEVFALMREPLETHVRCIEALVEEAGAPEESVFIMTLPVSEPPVEGTEFAMFACPAREMFEFIYSHIDDVGGGLLDEEETDYRITMRDLAFPS